MPSRLFQLRGAPLLRDPYVKAIKAIRKPIDSAGGLRLLDRYSEHRPVHWLRSQFAVYDFEDLTQLGVPWWTYGSIDEVDRWLTARPRPIRAFEWGAGASSMWLAPRVDELHSIEHDGGFAEAVARIAPDHVDVVGIVPDPTPTPVIGSQKKGFEDLDFERYVRAIDDVPGNFDLISIDGRARNECLLAAIDRLTDDGIIVFDNTDRDRYQEAMAKLDLDVEDYKGWAPALPIPSKTSIVRPRSR